MQARADISAPPELGGAEPVAFAFAASCRFIQSQAAAPGCRRFQL
jgi:hypothetical protein